jgi:hypothetical protein
MGHLYSFSEFFGTIRTGLNTSRRRFAILFSTTKTGDPPMSFITFELPFAAQAETPATSVRTRPEDRAREFRVSLEEYMARYEARQMARGPLPRDPGV